MILRVANTRYALDLGQRKIIVNKMDREKTINGVSAETLVCDTNWVKYQACEASMPRKIHGTERQTSCP